jgi:hypothetical protein
MLRSQRIFLLQRLDRYHEFNHFLSYLSLLVNRFHPFVENSISPKR